MVIHFPSKMAERLQANENINIHYDINQSVHTLTKQKMEKAVDKLNQEINIQVGERIDAQLLSTIPQMIAAESANEEIVEQVAGQTVSIMQEYIQKFPVKENLIKTNDKDGFVYTMVPLLIVLASYIGAMLISQHLQRSEEHTSELQS